MSGRARSQWNDVPGKAKVVDHILRHRQSWLELCTLWVLTVGLSKAEATLQSENLPQPFLREPLISTVSK